MRYSSYEEIHYLCAQQVPTVRACLSSNPLNRHNAMKSTLLSIWRFYAEGFRDMTWGRGLWVIILIKLFIMFFILRLFFFPDFLNANAPDDGKDEYVGLELIQRAGP